MCDISTDVRDGEMKEGLAPFFWLQPLPPGRFIPKINHATGHLDTQRPREGLASSTLMRVDQ